MGSMSRRVDRVSLLGTFWYARHAAPSRAFFCPNLAPTTTYPERSRRGLLAKIAAYLVGHSRVSRRVLLVSCRPPISDHCTSDFCSLTSRRERGVKSCCAAVTSFKESCMSDAPSFPLRIAAWWTDRSTRSFKSTGRYPSVWVATATKLKSVDSFNPSSPPADFALTRASKICEPHPTK